MQKNIKTNTVGFIGLGVMGMSMFKNLTKYKELSPQGFDIDNDKLSTLKKMNLKQASNIEEIFTIAASELLIICGMNALVLLTTPSKLILMTQSQLSSLMSLKCEPLFTPALLKTMSTFPWCSITFFGSSSMDSLLETSKMCDETDTLYFLNILTVSSNVFLLISQTQTSAPSFARRIAKYLPIPDPAPVITATFFLKDFMLNF